MNREPLKIGINALYLIPGRVGGSEIYLRRLLAALAAIDRENEYIIFTNRESRGTFELADNFREHYCPVRALVRPQRIIWEQLVLPWLVRRLKLDLIHSPGFVAPLFSSCPSVVTILDLIYRDFPQTFPPLARFWMEFLVAKSARRSSAVITLSEYSRGEIIWEFDIPSGKSRVIYMGVEESRADRLPPAEREELLLRHGIERPYILTVSATHPHKNLLRLVEAYSRLETGEKRHQLVIVGVRHNRYHCRLREVVERLELEKDVVLTGWVPEEVKETFYSEARLLVFPSLLEGFGLPVLEAMKRGLPVACSDVPSLKEAAGEGAFLFDPYSTEEIARAIRECLSNEELRGKLIAKGRDHAARFSWEKTARETIELYRWVLEEGKKSGRGGKREGKQWVAQLKRRRR